MLLTPEEARKQPCPLFRYCVNEGDLAQARGITAAIYVHESCKGPDCKIGWRWEQRDPPPSPAFDARGYCGFAGRP